jgi:hypothetical protein
MTALPDTSVAASSPEDRNHCAPHVELVTPAALM